METGLVVLRRHVWIYFRCFLGSILPVRLGYVVSYQPSVEIYGVPIESVARDILSRKVDVRSFWRDLKREVLKSSLTFLIGYGRTSSKGHWKPKRKFFGNSGSKLILELGLKISERFWGWCGDILVMFSTSGKAEEIA